VVRSSRNGTATPPAVVLVGGRGTRLWPLTEHIPKPLLPLGGRPILAHTFDQLRRAGIRRVTLASGYLPTRIERHFGRAYDGLAIEYRVEPQPLGTAGAIRFAAEGLVGSFLALNGDSLREADLSRLLAFHREAGALATILLTRVDDPSRYGLVRLEGGGRVAGFLEKPRKEEIDTHLINAGVYVLEPEVFDLIPAGKEVSIEREVFPVLAESKALFGVSLPGYWLDVGTPRSYLQAHLDLLARTADVVKDPRAAVGEGVTLVPPVHVEANAVVGECARVGPYVHVGRGAAIGAGARIRRSALLAGAAVPPGVVLDHAIVAPDVGVVPA
jgi:mannose-1-phosphate guanylyltransferase